MTNTNALTRYYNEIEGDYNVKVATLVICDALATQYTRMWAWEDFRMTMGSRIENGYTFDFYDELYEISKVIEDFFTSGNYDNTSWNLYADELNDCRK